MSLPDELLCRVRERGLLDPGPFMIVMFEAVRRWDEADAHFARLEAEARERGEPWLTEDEIQAEINAHYAEQRERLNAARP